MVAWETIELEDQPPYIRDFAEGWRATDKVVYSRTLGTVSGDRTRLERAFDVESIRELKAVADRDLAIGGPELARPVFEAGLVDEVQLFLAPIVVGGGKRCLPADLRVALELVDERRFANGVVHLRYRTNA